MLLARLLPTILTHRIPAHLDAVAEKRIINSSFSTSNRDDLRTYPDTVNNMYLRILSDQSMAA